MLHRQLEAAKLLNHTLHRCTVQRSGSVAFIHTPSSDLQNTRTPAVLWGPVRPKPASKLFHFSWQGKWSHGAVLGGKRLSIQRPK
jgi:hypothetical protein